MNNESEFTGPAESKEQEQTLVCFEFCGLWEISVDVTVKEPKKWFINIEGPQMSMPLELDAVHVVRAIVDYIEANNEPIDSENTQSRLRIGKFQGLPVHLQSDDEYPDRCFLNIGRAGKSAVQIKLSDEDLEHFVTALKSVLNNLEHDGLL